MPSAEKVTVTLPGASGEQAYPALFADEHGQVGCAVYLKKAEAYLRHDQGLCALLKIQLPGLLNAIRRDFKLPGQQEKIFFKTPPGAEKFNWKDDLLNSVILKTLGSPEERRMIRSKDSFDSAREFARGNFADCADRLFSTLNELIKSYENIGHLLKKLPSGSPAAADIRQQLEFYFRPGFLRYPVWHERTKRYLRGVELRLQRAIANPRQDAVKLEPLMPYIERFQLAVETVPELALTPTLYDFGLLLEELRLSVFAPEVRTLQKVSLEIVRKNWEMLRY